MHVSHSNERGSAMVMALGALTILAVIAAIKAVGAGRGHGGCFHHRGSRGWALPRVRAWHYQSGCTPGGRLFETERRSEHSMRL